VRKFIKTSGLIPVLQSVALFDRGKPRGMKPDAANQVRILRIQSRGATWMYEST